MGSLARLGSGALGGLLQPCMSTCLPAAQSLAAFAPVRHFAAAADDPSITVEVCFASALRRRRLCEHRQAAMPSQYQAISGKSLA